MESSKETQFEAKLTMVSLSEYAGLKHRLINVDAAPVLIRPEWKQRCFNAVVFMPQFLKIISCC